MPPLAHPLPSNLLASSSLQITHKAWSPLPLMGFSYGEKSPKIQNLGVWAPRFPASKALLGFLRGSRGRCMRCMFQELLEKNSRASLSAEQGKIKHVLFLYPVHTYTHHAARLCTPPSYPWVVSLLFPPIHAFYFYSIPVWVTLWLQDCMFLTGVHMVGWGGARTNPALGLSFTSTPAIPFPTLVSFTGVKWKTGGMGVGPTAGNPLLFLSSPSLPN